MRNCWLFFLLFSCFSINSKGQTPNELINQKSTQTQYLIQQIAGLQFYIGYLNKGYQIARKGLNTIGDIKHGHLGIDKIHFVSLEELNPNISNSKTATQTAALYEWILYETNISLKKLSDRKEYSNRETNYLREVLNNNVSECKNLMATLHVFLSNGVLKMSDDERMKHISLIYDELLDRCAFQKSFSNDIVMVSRQRRKEMTETKSAENFYK